MLYRGKQRYLGLLFILPWLTGFCILQLYPFIVSIYYSFSNLTILRTPDLIGFQNYINLFQKDKHFYQALKVTFIYVLIAVPLKLLFSLFIAMVLNMKIKYINFFRTVYYMPSILGGSIAISVLWRFLFARDGLINNFLGVFGLVPIDWLGSPDYALMTISLLTVWQFGSSMVIFLAGLKQIPSELYEAAKIDGAGKYRTFMRITLPMLTPMIFFNLIMQMVHAFQEFTAAMVITSGGPLKSTYLYGLMLYETAFKYSRMGYASAQSWILFIIIMFFTLLVSKTAPYWTYYDDGGK
jgi:oligogalacturonide transport system permease protein